MSNAPVTQHRPVKTRNFEYDYRFMKFDELIEAAQRAGYSLRNWRLTRHLQATLRYNGYRLAQ